MPYVRKVFLDTWCISNHGFCNILHCLHKLNYTIEIYFNCFRKKKRANFLKKYSHFDFIQTIWALLASQFYWNSAMLKKSNYLQFIYWTEIKNTMQKMINTKEQNICLRSLVCRKINEMETNFFFLPDPFYYLVFVLGFFWKPRGNLSSQNPHLNWLHLIILCLIYYYQKNFKYF